MAEISANPGIAAADRASASPPAEAVMLAGARVVLHDTADRPMAIIAVHPDAKPIVGELSPMAALNLAADLIRGAQRRLARGER